MLQVPNQVKSDLVFNERLTDFSVDIYRGQVYGELSIMYEGRLPE